MRFLEGVPTDDELSEFFGYPLIDEGQRAQGLWTCKVDDSRGVTLTFAFHIVEDYVSVDLAMGEVPIFSASSEGVQRLRIVGSKLIADFTYKYAQTELVLTLGEAVNVTWRTLRTE